MKLINFFILHINLSAPNSRVSASKLTLHQNLLARLQLRFFGDVHKFFYGFQARGFHQKFHLRGSKNSAQLKFSLGKKSFQQKNNCLKGGEAVFYTFVHSSTCRRCPFELWLTAVNCFNWRSTGLSPLPVH